MSENIKTYYYVCNVCKPQCRMEMDLPENAPNYPPSYCACIYGKESDWCEIVYDD